MLRNNNSLKAIQENRSAAGYEIDRAKAGYGPRVDLTARGGFGKLTDSTTRSYNYDEAAPYSSASLLVTQPLWDGWLTRGRVREAEATYRSLDHRVMDNANSLALDAIIAHVDVLRRQQIYQLAQDNVSRHEEILEKAREREAQGVDTMADVSQAQSRLSRARSTLTEARASLRIGEDTYTRLTRLSAMSLGPVNLPSKMFSGPEEVLKAAQKGNPKVAAYMEDVKAASAVREQARSAYSPSLSIEAGPSYSDRDGKSELWTAEVGVAAVVRWNLFNSGADVAESKAPRPAFVRAAGCSTTIWTILSSTCGKAGRNIFLRRSSFSSTARPSSTTRLPATPMKNSSSWASAVCSTCWTLKTNCSTRPRRRLRRSATR